MKLIKPIIVVFLLFCIIGSFATAESYSNQPINWGLKKSTNGVPAEAGKAWDDLLAKHGAFYKADPSKKEIYLTFDNGYENGYTAQILDVLKKGKSPCDLFCYRALFRNSPRFSETNGNRGAYCR